MDAAAPFPLAVRKKSVERMAWKMPAPSKGSTGHGDTVQAGSQVVQAENVALCQLLAQRLTVEGAAMVQKRRLDLNALLFRLEGP